jgi:hypothetical protein
MIFSGRSVGTRKGGKAVEKGRVGYFGQIILSRNTSTLNARQPPTTTTDFRFSQDKKPVDKSYQAE